MIEFRSDKTLTFSIISKKKVMYNQLTLIPTYDNMIGSGGRETMSNRIITISREFGSGGRTIGRRTAEKLGIPCYDAELVQKIAEESGYAEAYVREEGEETAGGWLSTILSDRTNGLTNQDKIWNIQSKVITELAEKGPCVIVGRCADYILREKADLLTVFIHASMEKRAERIVKEYGEREETPEQRLKDKDKRRAAYHRFYTDMKWGQAQNYDICLDSGELGLDKCIDILVQLY
jgi:cytidylate kinase